MASRKVDRPQAAWTADCSPADKALLTPHQKVLLQNGRQRTRCSAVFTAYVLKTQTRYIAGNEQRCYACSRQPYSTHRTVDLLVNKSAAAGHGCSASNTANSLLMSMHDTALHLICCQPANSCGISSTSCRGAHPFQPKSLLATSTNCRYRRGRAVVQTEQHTTLALEVKWYYWMSYL